MMFIWGEHLHEDQPPMWKTTCFDIETGLELVLLFWTFLFSHESGEPSDVLTKFAVRFACFLRSG